MKIMEPSIAIFVVVVISWCIVRFIEGPPKTKEERKKEIKFEMEKIHKKWKNK